MNTIHNSNKTIYLNRISNLSIINIELDNWRLAYALQDV